MWARLFCLLHVLPQSVERHKARRPKTGVTLGGDYVLLESGDTTVDLGDDLHTPSSEQRRVHGPHHVDEGVGPL